MRKAKGLNKTHFDLDRDLERDRLVLAFFLLTERDLDRERDVERERLRRLVTAPPPPPAAGFLPSAMFISFDCSFEMDPLSGRDR